MFKICSTEMLMRWYSYRFWKMDSELLYNCTVLETLPFLYSVVHEIPQEANSGKIKSLGILGF